MDERTSKPLWDVCYAIILKYHLDIFHGYLYSINADHNSRSTSSNSCGLPPEKTCSAYTQWTSVDAFEQTEE